VSTSNTRPASAVRSVAVTAQPFDVRKSSGRLSAVEERHVMVAFERRVDDMPAEEPGAAEDRMRIRSSLC
jgi:hypothetical protein